MDGQADRLRVSHVQRELLAFRWTPLPDEQTHRTALHWLVTRSQPRNGMGIREHGQDGEGSPFTGAPSFFLR